jgi:hypothetical protein
MEDTRGLIQLKENRQRKIFKRKFTFVILNKVVPENAIAGGVPARLLKNI